MASHLRRLLLILTVITVCVGGKYVKYNDGDSKNLSSKANDANIYRILQYPDTTIDQFTTNTLCRTKRKQFERAIAKKLLAKKRGLGKWSLMANRCDNTRDVIQNLLAVELFHTVGSFAEKLVTNLCGSEQVVLRNLWTADSVGEDKLFDKKLEHITKLCDSQHDMIRHLLAAKFFDTDSNGKINYDEKNFSP